MAHLASLHGFLAHVSRLHERLIWWPRRAVIAVSEGAGAFRSIEAPSRENTKPRMLLSYVQGVVSMTSPRLLNVSPTLGRSIREFAGGQQPAENDRWQSVFRQIAGAQKCLPIGKRQRSVFQG